MEQLISLLAHGRVQIPAGRAFIGRHPGGWQTVPWSRQSRHCVHRMFFSPDARLVLRLADGDVDLAPRTLIWLPPRTEFRLRLESDRQRELLYRFVFLVRRKRSLVAHDRPLYCPQAGFCADLLRQIASELPFRWEFRDERLRFLVGLLATAALRQIRASTSEGFAPHQLEWLVGHVGAREGERPSPAELAAALNMTPERFAQCVRSTFGVAPRRWLVEERLRRAAMLLTETSLPVKQVAERLGYDNQFLLSRQFRSLFGCSPSEYRSRR